jgi:hypothetical protein
VGEPLFDKMSLLINVFHLSSYSSLLLKLGQHMYRKYLQNVGKFFLHDVVLYSNMSGHSNT